MPVLVPGRPRWQPAALLVLLVVAALLRLALFDYRSPDYQQFLEPWALFIDRHGGFSALKYGFSNYNAPYLYLMAAASYLPLSPLVTVKLISAIFEVMLGWYVYRLLALRYPSGWLPFAGVAVVTLLPTVVLNGSMWGQADSTYAALAAGGLYHLILRRHWRACVFFAIALGFKLQIIFLFPVLLLLALRKWLPWRALLAIPVVYLLLDVPALLLGAYWRRLLLIYLHQADRYNELSINAPTIYTFLPADPALRRIGVAVTGLVLLGLIGLAVWRRVEITPARIVLFSSLSVLLTPFLLPSMHERYFYLADVLTVVTALWFASRALIAVPLLVQLASLSCYLNYLLKPYRWAERTGNAIPPVYEHGYWSARWLLSFPHLDLRILSACVAIAIGLTFSFVLAEGHKSELERQVAAQIS